MSGFSHTLTHTHSHSLTQTHAAPTPVSQACLRHLPPPAVQLSTGVDQRVGAQDDAGALGPLRTHQRVLPHQDLADVLCARHSDQRLSQQVCLEHVSVALPTRDVEV